MLAYIPAPWILWVLLIPHLVRWCTIEFRQPAGALGRMAVAASAGVAAAAALSGESMGTAWPVKQSLVVVLGNGRSNQSVLYGFMMFYANICQLK